MKTKKTFTFNIGWKTWIGAILTAFVWIAATIVEKITVDKTYYDRLMEVYQKRMEGPAEVKKKENAPALGFNRYK